jgi:predicted secreted Zn-dependent protease
MAAMAVTWRGNKTPRRPVPCLPARAAPVLRIARALPTLSRPRTSPAIA